jgi:hypothetical protein
MVYIVGKHCVASVIIKKYQNKKYNDVFMNHAKYSILKFLSAKICNFKKKNNIITIFFNDSFTLFNKNLVLYC